MESRFHAPEEFLGKFGSKSDLYNLLNIDRYYLPSFKNVTLDFMRQILSKKKKAIRLKQAKFIYAPRYAELGVEKIWPLVKEIEELNEFFPFFKENQYPERSFMWTIISTLRPDATKKLIDDARKHRSIKSEENEDQLVEVDPEIFKEIQAVISQKAHSGKVPYLLKKSAKLQRDRAKPKEYAANYELLKSTTTTTPARFETASRDRRSLYSTPTIEMTDAREEEKETRPASRMQRHAHSRHEYK